MVIPKPGHPHAVTGDTLPIVLCHEFCGKIAGPVPAGQKAADGQELKEGMPVMVDPRVNCQNCHSCIQLRSSNICPSWGFHGLSGGGGGFAEKCAVRANMCYPLPESVDLRNAALIEPLAVGRRALTQCQFAASEWSKKSVLILGGGPVGIAVIFNLLAFGVEADRIFCSEPTALRQEQCKKLIKAVFNPRDVKVPDECRRATGGEGVDVVFDCAGVAPGMKDGMNALRRQGTYMNVAGWETAFELPMQWFMMKEIVVRTIMAYNNDDFAETVKDYVDGKFKGAEMMVTARIGLDDVPKKGFEALVHNKDAHVKILATPKKELLG
ncbi:hypothetical protein LTR86_000086 [Recurvomyces mirabilis]|nr:hypothetical protein LTR86_000086 [Recurvomyces mirabilis]